MIPIHPTNDVWYETPTHVGFLAGPFWPGGQPDVNEGAAAGSVGWAGTATGTTIREGAASGGIGWSGSASGETVHEAAASGAVSWAGVASGVSAFQGAASGGITWSGSATGEAPSIAPNEGAAAGAIGWAGAITDKAVFKGLATGSIVWVGSAEGEPFEDSSLVRFQEGVLSVSDQDGVFAAAVLSGGLVVSTQSAKLEVTQ